MPNAYLAKMGKPPEARTVEGFRLNQLVQDKANRSYHFRIVRLGPKTCDLEHHPKRPASARCNRVKYSTIAPL